MTFDWTTLIAPFLGGGALTGLGTLLITSRSNDRRDSREEFAAIIGERRIEIASLNKQLEEAEAKIRILETEQRSMATQLAVLESRSVQAPFPEWDVDRSSRYLWCNTEFELRFLRPRGYDRQWLIGRTHDELWPKEVADVLFDMDREATTRPSRTSRRDTVVVPGRTERYDIIKFAALNSITGAHIGFHGLAIGDNF